MDSERWARVKALFHAALEREADERAAYLREACAGDEALGDEVSRLVASHAEGGEFLEPPMGVREAGEAAFEELDEGGVDPIGVRIAGFRVVGVLGRGGMGNVYRAEQDRPRREVALKVIRRGVATPRMLRRFAHEAEVLGRLKHAAIAQIYEAGVAEVEEVRQAYFVMELVEGEPLTVYASRRGLEVRARLELMARVCDGVHHAHQKGVIHRDLKPSNILVTGSGQPKIIDFGVARGVDADVQTTTVLTDHGEIIGTLRYMSPEQCLGDPREIDTRSDVYALGVVCYELLSGRPAHRLDTPSIGEVIRIIREDEPASLGTVDRELRGDPATMVSKAMRKEREGRYDSAAAFAEDIRAYLDGEPISARRATTMYQLRKFAGRHRALVGGVCVVLVVLVAGIVAVSLALADVRRERDRLAGTMGLLAEWRANRGTRILTDPGALENLETVSEMVLGGQVRDAELRFYLHDWLGEIYASAGQPERAIAHHRAAWELNRDRFGTCSNAALRDVNLLVPQLLEAGDPSGAEAMVQEALAACGFGGVEEVLRVDGGRDGVSGLRLSKLARDIGLVWRDLGRFDESEAILRETLVVQRTLSAGIPEHEQHDVLASMRALAGTLVEAGRSLDEAEGLIAAAGRYAVGTGRDKLWMAHDLARVRLARGDVAGAEAALGESVSGAELELGRDHPLSVRLRLLVGRIRLERGDVPGAVSLLRECVESSVRARPEHWRSGVCRAALGEALVAASREGEAAEEFREALSIYRRAGFGEGHFRVRRALGGLARAEASGGG